jgi:DNA-binding transcriptional ArsR family regulator
VEDAEIERLLGRAPRLALEDIVRHPLLPEARKVYLERFLEVYGGDPFLVRLLIESGRFLVCQIALLLDAAHDPARRETWPTVGLLEENVAMFGLASGRHIDHLISRLCAVGYMQLLPSDRDRRVRILKPTEKLSAHDRDWLAAHCAPLAVLYPQYDYHLVMRRDPEFHAVHRRESMRFLPLAAKILMSLPDTLLFFNHAGGSMVMSALLQAASSQQDYPHAAVPYADVGARFGISRTQVRKLLMAAEDAGLVKLHARGGRRVEILPRFWSSHDRGLASGMYINDIAYLAATTAFDKIRPAASAFATAPPLQPLV